MAGKRMNSTQLVVREAMRLTSKDVRAPKVVRDGIVKAKKVHGNVKCDCGHTQKDHYAEEGFCHHSKHKKAGKCGCTWFHPNVNYIRRKNGK